MFCFYGNQDLGTPSQWPEGMEFPSQRSLIAVAFDSKQFELNRGAMNYGGIVQSDETALDNQTRCVDIFNRQGETDFMGLGKYYVRTNDFQIWERFGWKKSSQGTYAPDSNQDIQIVFGRSVEKGDFEDQYQRRQNLLDVMRTVPSVDPVVLNLYIQQLAEIVENMQRLKTREFRPDQ
jgi:hypothetical protein